MLPYLCLAFLSKKNRTGQLDGLNKISRIKGSDGGANLASRPLLKWMQKMPASLRFIPPMECLEVQRIPEGELWQYELKMARL